MDPISVGIMAVGLGMQIFGGVEQSRNAEATAKVSQDVAKQEQAINTVKQRQMEMEGRRTQLENIRNNQRARAMSQSAAVNQGAQFGTGLQGGLAQINDQSAFNMLGVESALQNGREIYGYNTAISKDKQQLAQLGADSATAQGITSLGGAVLKAGPIVGQISQGFGFGSSKGGNYTGTPGASNTGGLY